MNGHRIIFFSLFYEKQQINLALEQTASRTDLSWCESSLVTIQMNLFI